MKVSVVGYNAVFRGVSFQLASDEAKTSASRMLTPLCNFDKARMNVSIHWREASGFLASGLK